MGIEVPFFPSLEKQSAADWHYPACLLIYHGQMVSC